MTNMLIPEFIYPPRPEVTIPPADLVKFENGEYLGQPKYNGDCTEISFDGGAGNFTVWNRHKEMKQGFKLDMRSAYRGSGRMVLCGEYLSKNQLGEFGQDINRSFVIWDIIVYDNQWLIGTTTEERLELLERLYPCNKSVITAGGKLLSFNHLCCTDMDMIFKAPTYTHGWTELYNEIVQTPLYEGFVLKKRDAKLEFGFTEINNNRWQVKCRKPTKNYQF